MSNLDLWNTVQETDPAKTKPVNLRGKFTAIDSYYQIKRATDTFGPVGIGWGYDAEFRFQENLAIAVVKLWYKWDGKVAQGFPVCATNQYKTDKGHIDEDAAKKALTDAITKALSYIGFSADVFMGKFDDNRYVAELNKKMRAEEQATELEEQIVPLIEAIKDAVSYAKQREAVVPLFASLKALAPARAAHYQAEMEKLKAQHVATKTAGAA